MSMINIVLIFIGLLMCFGGIYFKKLFAGLMGLCWSLTVGSLFLIITLLSGNIQVSAGILLIGIFVLVCTVISVVYDKICAAINSFMGVFSILFIFTMVIGTSENRLLYIILSIIISLIPAGISYYLYNWAFVLNTAFSGAFIANLGGAGLFLNIDFSETVRRILFGNGDFLGPILVGTIVLGCIGTVVQFQKLNKGINSSSDGSKLIMDLTTNTETNIGSMKALFGRIINSEIMLDFRSEKICLIICLIGFIVLPLVNNQINWLEVELALFVNRTYFVMETAAFAGVVYWAHNKKIRSGIVYCIPYVIVRLILQGSWMKFALGIAIVLLAEPFVVLFTSYLLKKLMKTDFKYWISVCILIFYRYLLIRWVNLRKIYWAITKEDIVPIFVFVILLAILVYVKNKKNIFNLALFINQKAGKQITNNKVIAVVAGFIIVIFAFFIILNNYVQKEKRYNNSAAGQHQNKDDETEKDNSSSFEINKDYLSGSRWEVLCIFDSDDNEIFQQDILGNNVGTPFGISFYGEDRNFDGDYYGLYLGNGTRGEMDNQRWGEYSCQDNVVSLKCDMHGDTIELEYMTITYEGKLYETLKLKESISIDYDYSDIYTIYLVNQFDLPDMDNVGKNDSSITPEEMVAILTAEPWEVYCAYDYYTAEPLDIGLIYGNMAAFRGANYLRFNEDGTFRFCLGFLFSNNDNEEMTGIYECSGSRVTLYSDRSTTVIEMEYTDLDYYDWEAMSLKWIDNMSATATQYRVYLVNPSFYQ